MNTMISQSIPGQRVDLAAIALQHREKARQEQLNAEQDRVRTEHAEALAVQRRAIVNILLAKIEKEAKTNARTVEKEAKALAEQTQDFATAARMIEQIEPQWRNAKLYENICGYRDRVKALDASIQEAVHKRRLRFLRCQV